MYSTSNRWAFGAALIICSLLLAFMAGCACVVSAPCHDDGAPYTTERPTVPFHVMLTNAQGVNAWDADGAPTVLTVHNPTDRRVQLHVVCSPSVDVGYIDRGHIEAWPCLAPHEEQARFAEFMNIDATRSVCHVAESWSIPSTEWCLGNL